MNYTKEVNLAHRLIKKFGEQVIWKKPQTQDATHSNDPWHVTATDPILYTIMMCFVTPRSSFKALFSYLKGTDVPEGGMRGLMGAVNFIPQLGDCVIRSENVLAISSIEVLNPGGTILMYSIEFKA